MRTMNLRRVISNSEGAASYAALVCKYKDEWNEKKNKREIIKQLAGFYLRKTCLFFIPFVFILVIVGCCVQSCFTTCFKTFKKKGSIFSFNWVNWRWDNALKISVVKSVVKPFLISFSGHVIWALTTEGIFGSKVPPGTARQK